MTPRCRIVATNGTIAGPEGSASVQVSVCVDTVLRLLSLERPIVRCLAAREIAPAALEGIVSSASLARNLRRVGRALHPSLIERAHKENPPLRKLIRVAWGSGVDEQQRRWDALDLDAPANDVVVTRDDPPAAMAA
ncbi:MAG TPA: hypothetical protein VK459_03705 [Polyangiaceae bacterium]|nr:hypothetical protein [Polyangiaceae bacterium]